MGVYQGDVIKGIDTISTSLGSWQHKQYRDNKGRMNSLIKEIDKLVDEPRMDLNTERLREAHAGLGRLYTSKEAYWA